MKEYSKDLDAKVSIDKLQIQFECCGSHNYRDWFHIPWIRPENGGVIPVEVGDFVSDDVPFSCCSGGSLRPCIHHKILSTHHIYRYDPQRHLSISTRGCSKALEQAGNDNISKQSVLTVITATVQAIIGVCSRILQTSVMSRLEENDLDLGSPKSHEAERSKKSASVEEEKATQTK
ncbi:hypothetical protein L9F63_015774, partial [Diploptera punctata]